MSCVFYVFMSFDIGVKIKSVGGYLPDKILTNLDMEKLTDTTDEWIFQRTGITKRHICEMKTSDMATSAAIDCLNPINQLKSNGVFVAQNIAESYKFDTKNFASYKYFDNENNNKKNLHEIKNQDFVEYKNIDCLIVATTTPDLTFPSTACIVQSKLKELGYSVGFAFDIQAVCAGFVYGLSVANSFLKNKICKNAIVVGADKLSSILNWQDRTTCVLFGDGAGAVLLESFDIKTNPQNKSNLLYETLHSDGSLMDILKTSSGVATNGQAGHIMMDGKDVFTHAVNKMSESIFSIIKNSKLSKDDINFVIAHQANERILDGVAKKLEMTKTNFIKTVGIHANTSSASIPLALNHCLNNNLIKRGDNIIFEALGGGLVWGGILCKG